MSSNMITELGRADVPRAASLFAAFTHDRARLESYLSAHETGIFTGGDARIFVDDPTSPAVVMLVGPDPIADELSFLAGDPAAPALRPLLKHVAAIPGVDPLVFTVATSQWEFAMLREFGAGVCPTDAITFASFRPDCEYVRSWPQRVPAGCTLRRIDRDWIDRAAELAPRFWPKREKFFSDSIGFCLCQGERVLSMVHAVWRPTQLMEMEVATAQDVRGRGYGALTCGAMLEYCLDRGIEPVWTCNSRNHASLAFARKMGFADPVHHIWFKWTPFNAGRKMVVLPSATLREYVGHYRMNSIPAEIRLGGDSLLYIDENSQELSLGCEAVDRFFFRYFDIQVEFTRSADGRVDGLIRHQSGREFRLARE